MINLYPIKFKPVLKEKVWGGNNLQKNFGKSAPPEKLIGESWEISGLQGDLSVVTNGFLEGNNIEDIIEVYMGDLVGDEIYERFGLEFPLLIKLIDAHDILSLQVHPDDKLARERHNAYGKTEMWYILEAEKEAVVYSGFKKDSSIDQYLEYLENNRIDSLLNIVNPEKGDYIFMPSGQIHTLGKGVVLVEIQQSSDITYRIHDWGRVGLDGKPRDLHLDLAKDAIDYSASADPVKSVDKGLNSPVNLVDCKYFTTNIINLQSTLEREAIRIDSFKIYICVDGSFEIDYYNQTMKVDKGETVLIPASLEDFRLKSKNALLLEIYIDTKKFK